MTRRITATIVGVVVGAMLLAGLGTLIATRLAGRQRELTQLETRADAIADLVPALPAGGTAGGSGTGGGTGSSGAPTTTPVQDRLVRVLGLSGVTQLRVTRAGVLIGRVPAWIPARALDPAALAAGTTLSGARGNRLWAAASRPNPNGSSTVALVTGNREPIIGPALRWLAFSGAVALALGIGVAFLLARRLGRPIHDAVAVTERIAAGDLSARLDVPDRARSDDELVALAVAINAMAAELGRSRALEHQFLMSVSHDLRTPLTSIRGYAEAIADGVGSSPAASAEVIVAESERLERLVADLLDLAKLDARQFGFRPTDTRVGPVITSAVAAITPEASAHGLAVHVSVDVDPVVHADVDRLAQVIGNLSTNSLRYARTAVWIRTREAAAAGRPGVAIDVADDGPGIAEVDLPHVFERLYRATSRVEPHESGSGLGLAIVKELTEGMGGTVAVASVPGAGATFTVWLPTR